jgi:tetratricopeptide (TPR) repeat protein
LRGAETAAEVRKELRAAEARFRKVLEMQAGEPEPAPGAWQDHFGQGRALMLLGETALARSSLERAAQLWRVEVSRLAALALVPGSGPPGLGGVVALWSSDPRGGSGHALLGACRSYCCSRLGDHAAALALGGGALEEGYRSAALLNNLGLSALRANKEAEATRYLDEALRRSPNLVPALYNRCLNPLRRRLRTREPLPRWALADIERAVRLMEQNPGQEPTEVYRVAAQLHAVGAIDARGAGDANEEHRRLEKTKEYLIRGCMFGLDPELQLRDPNLSHALGDWLRRDRLEGRQLRPAVAVVTSYLVDPLEGR